MRASTYRKGEKVRQRSQKRAASQRGGVGEVRVGEEGRSVVNLHSITMVQFVAPPVSVVHRVSAYPNVSASSRDGAVELSQLIGGAIPTVCSSPKFALRRHVSSCSNNSVERLAAIQRGETLSFELLRTPAKR